MVIEATRLSGLVQHHLSLYSDIWSSILLLALREPAVLELTLQKRQVGSLAKTEQDAAMRRVLAPNYLLKIIQNCYSPKVIQHARIVWIGM